MRRVELELDALKAKILEMGVVAERMVARASEALVKRDRAIVADVLEGEETLDRFQVEIDGEAVRLPEHFIYKGMMLSEVPNLFLSFGYANASWTLRSDLTARNVCRLLNRMEARGLSTCVPKVTGAMGKRPVLGLSSGYVDRAKELLPSQGDRDPWFVPQHYLRDAAAMTLRPIDEALEFA